MKLSVRRLAQLAVMVALLVISALITVPLRPVPITLQDVLVVLTPLLFGETAYVAVLAYLLLGLVGLPVFAGGLSGMATFSGPTGGFLIGFLLVAIVIGLIAGHRPGKSFAHNLILSEGSLVLIYVPGILWMQHVLALRGASERAALVALVPVFAVDVLKMVFTALLVRPLQEALAEKEEVA